MFGQKIAAGLLALLLGATIGACGNDDTVDAERQGPGQSPEEDPTLGDPEGGGTTDEGVDGTGGQSRDDGSDEGNPASGSSDDGSGTGAGRGDG